jgi:hypothetical protein
VYLYPALQFACVAFFVLAVPLLLVARVRSNVPWWFVIASATAVGWIFANASVFIQHVAVDEDHMKQIACFAHPPDHGSVSVVNGETAIDNPCWLGDWILDSYKPIAGLLYGPPYLLCCLLPYWLIVGRRSRLVGLRQDTNGD